MYLKASNRSSLSFLSHCSVTFFMGHFLPVEILYKAYFARETQESAGVNFWCGGFHFLLSTFVRICYFYSKTIKNVLGRLFVQFEGGATVAQSCIGGGEWRWCTHRIPSRWFIYLKLKTYSQQKRLLIFNYIIHFFF